jgi:hypothetical protein
MASLGLLLFTIPMRFIASTCKTTNLPSHLCTIDCKHRETPRSSLDVEDSLASHCENYSRAIYIGPVIV